MRGPPGRSGGVGKHTRRAGSGQEAHSEVQEGVGGIGRPSGRAGMSREDLLEGLGA